MGNSIEKTRAVDQGGCGRCGHKFGKDAWVARISDEKVWHWRCWEAFDKDVLIHDETLRNVRKLLRNSEVRSVNALPGGAPGLRQQRRK
jgi:hypothetical protein